METEAILAIIARLNEGEWEGVSSDAVDFEIDQTTDRDRRERVWLTVPRVSVHVRVEPEHFERAAELRVLGFRPVDALHLACAEASSTDVFLTTDDSLTRRAVRVASSLRVRVANPLAWIAEVLPDEA